MDLWIDNLKKFTPHITIWNLELRDKDEGLVVDNICFFSYKRADKFWEEHESELENYNVAIIKGTLWLW